MKLQSRFGREPKLPLHAISVRYRPCMEHKQLRCSLVHLQFGLDKFIMGGRESQVHLGFLHGGFLFGLSTWGLPLSIESMLQFTYALLQNRQRNILLALGVL